MHTTLTDSMDVAQVVLYVFWVFFAGLIYWLRMEDRREGYPLESDNPRRVGVMRPGLLIPAPKTFLLMHGGTYTAPNFDRDEREVHAVRSAASAGSPLDPIGDPMLSGVGPASFAQRADEPELTTHGLDMIVPLRIATDFWVSAGPDPRGWEVVAADGKVAGTVKEIWIDRTDYVARYLEVELTVEGDAPATTRLLPVPMMRLLDEKRRVQVASIKAAHFAHVPGLTKPDRITLLEEDKIGAFYAAGRLYADPKRLGPVV